MFVHNKEIQENALPFSRPPPSAAVVADAPPLAHVWPGRQSPKIPKTKSPTHGLHGEGSKSSVIEFKGRKNWKNWKNWQRCQIVGSLKIHANVAFTRQFFPSWWNWRDKCTTDNCMSLHQLSHRIGMIWRSGLYKFVWTQKLPHTTTISWLVQSIPSPMIHVSSFKGGVVFDRWLVL